MKRKLRNSAWLASVLFMMSIVCSAQYRPTASAAVDSVRGNGLYGILLPPALVARCRADLSDLRVYDQEGRETPYVLKIFGRDELNVGYRAIPDPQMRRQDSSNRHTYFWLHYDDAYLIDWLGFVIENPVLYKREAVISSLDDSSTVATVSIDPMDTVFRLKPVKTRGLLIDIRNNDNPPLVIRRVVGLQSNIFVVALLQADRRYKLVAGDPSVPAPEYDLHFFTDSLTTAPPVIRLGAVHRDKLGTVLTQTKATGPGLGRSGLLLWAIVTLILLLLIYVSVKLARAVNKKGEDDRL
jgi:hypothetical protein